jgi:hypothetical protein
MFKEKVKKVNILENIKKSSSALVHQLKRNVV